MDEACNSFRDFIQSKGISDALVSAMESLHRLRRKPHNPIEFIRQNLPPVQKDTIASLTSELEELKKDIQNIRKRLPEKKVPEPEIEVIDEESEHEDFDDTEQAESEPNPNESRPIAIDTNVEHAEVTSEVAVEKEVDVSPKEIDVSPTEGKIEDSNGVDQKEIDVLPTNDAPISIISEANAKTEEVNNTNEQTIKPQEN